MAVGVLGATGAPAASAADGTAAIDCDSATFHYTGFGGGTHVVQETIYEDTGQPLWNRVAQVEFTFEGDTADHQVDFTLTTGSHVIRPDAWELNATPPFTGEEPHVNGFIPPPGTNLTCDAPPSRPSGSADIDCAGATFHYSGFGAGTHVVQETLYEDTGQPNWDRLSQAEFTFEGDSAIHKVDLPLGPGSHTIRPDSWHVNTPTPGDAHVAGFIPPPSTTLACGTPGADPAGTADIDCTGATFHYTGFGGGTHVVQETVYEDTGQPLWNRLTQVEFTFQGNSATHKVDLTLAPSSHTVRPDAWQLNSPTAANPHIAGFIPPPPTTVDCGTPTARDPHGTADIDCDSVTYHYSGFGSGTHVIQETVYEDTGLPLWNRLTQDEFTFTGDSADHEVGITLPAGRHTIRRDAWQLNPPTGEAPHVAGFIPPPPTTVDCGSGPCTTNCTPPPCTANCTPACPSGAVSMRWHYAPSGSSGKWSTTKSATCPSTLTFSRVALDGDLKVNPGTQIKAGYSFKAPRGAITIAPKVDFTIRCADDKVTPSRPTWTVNLPTQTYNVTGVDWLPSGDQTSSVSYQGRAPIPDFCRGGKVRLDRGGVFTAKLS
jgi:hypothetical protein